MPKTILCAITGAPFVVSDQEIELYHSLDLPLPTITPDERTRRILARRNERVLYKRRCSATNAPIVSIHHERVPFPVYTQEYWWSDNWDQYAQGREYDFSKGFFEQFKALYDTVPQVALNSPQSENSEWTNQSGFNKNCYMMFCSGYSESCMFGMWNTRSEYCVDCGAAFDCKWCYQVFNCNNCFQCRNSDNLEQCSDCLFCRELIACNDCIGCVGLAHKKFHIFNQPYSEEEYTRIKQAMRLSTRSGIAELEAKYGAFEVQFPRRFYNGLQAVQSSGDYLIRTENVHNSYNYRESKNLWHCRDGWKCHDSIGLLETWTQERCVETEGSLGNSRSAFCNKIWEGGDLWYSSHIYYSRDVFGCVSLKHAEYCILNKRYAKDDYFALRARIVAQMKKNGEWGENFPIAHSPFAYNLSMGQEYFPLTAEQAKKRGYRWSEEASGESAIKSYYAVPDAIEDVVEKEALSQVVKCAHSGKLFKFQKSELAFYKNQSIPLPVLHPDVRYYHRMSTRRNPRSLHEGSCFSCGVPFLTTYRADAPYKVACERCYSEHRDECV